MIKFKEYLNEYRKAPMVDEFSKFTLQTFILDVDNLTQLKVSSAVDTKTVITFEYSIDANHKVFILTDRVDHTDIVGYLFLKKVKKYWQSLGTAIFDPFKRRGLGTDLYLNVINAGFQLINGSELSDSSEKLWLKLKDLSDVKVLNFETDEIEDWSDKPTKDNAAVQQWFWISESKFVNEHFGGNLIRDTQFKQWVSGNPAYKFVGFSATRYCVDGEY